MGNDQFVHLHVHSEFSLLDGLGKVKALCQRAAELGMPAIAVTDHGTMFATIQFYRQARAAGIKPIIGCEMYVAPRRMQDKDPALDRKPYHLVLLAENQTGYLNLLKIASAAQLEGYYYSPRVDKEFLARHAEGLIALSACGSGEIPRRLLEQDEEGARQAAAWYREVFGPENFFIELQDHEIPELRRITPRLIELAGSMDIPLVATNDVHYVRQEDAPAHDILLCIQTNSVVSEAHRIRMSDDGYYLKTAEEMAQIFEDVPDALKNTLWIAERCEVDLESNGYHLPHFDVPPAYPDAQTYLRALVEAGIRERYPDLTPEIQARVAYELDVIHQMGFDTYFLIVWDLCQASKARDIWWNVRGSGAASIVAYALGITKLDPLAHKLVFERFLNPGRISMPDIDLDYPDDRRAEMIQYTIEKYGADKVAQIITFGTLGAKAAIRDVGRALDIDLGEVNRIAKLVPEGPKVTIDRALEDSAELRELYESDEVVRNWLDMARSVEGIARHASTHAAGVVISDEPLVNYTPLHRPTGDSSDTSCPTTQFPMEILESIGLLKVDFLGLSTLTLMRLACDLIRERHGVSLDLDTIPLEDEEAFALLSSGNVTGVFQVESAGMRRVLTSMRPTKLEHIVATVALYRPGPMEYIDTYIRRMHGEEEVTYKHPLLEPILGETYGIIVYQEQIIRILTDLAGYSGSEADLLRRAVGKKKAEVLNKHRELFIQGCQEHSGIDEETAEAIYGDILYFARYGFNKAHAADYAVITCQTAYLKAHYPVEYMTALLTVERHNTEKVGFLVAECRRMGIAVLPPDINKSREVFTIEGDAIRFGLSAIKNVGEGAVELILKARDVGAEFAGLDDFCRRVDLRQINKRVVECLIKVGALDRFGPRHQLLAALDRIMSESAHYHQAREVGQMTMFDLGDGFRDAMQGSLLTPLPHAEPIPHKQLLAWEKELVGVYVSEHPLQRVVEEAGHIPLVGSNSVSEESVGQVIWMAGIVTAVRETADRAGRPMAFVELEDLEGSFDVVVFSRLYNRTRDLWSPDKLLLLKVKVDKRGERIGLLCESVQENFVKYEFVDSTGEGEGEALPNGRLDSREPPAAQSLPQKDRVLHICFRRTGSYEQDVQYLQKVYELLQKFQGRDRCVLHVQDEQKSILLEFPNLSTEYCPQLERYLRSIRGIERTWVNVHTAAK